MKLIIFLGLIAMLALVCDGCSNVTTSVTSIDWKQFTNKSWYLLMAERTDVANFVECLNATFTYINTIVSLVDFAGYFNGLPAPYKQTGIAIYNSSTAYFEVVTTTTLTDGTYYIIVVNYQLYVIIKYCYPSSNKPVVYVWFRSPKPDGPTWDAAYSDMKKNNISTTNLVQLKADRCLPAKPLTGGGSSLPQIGVTFSSSIKL